MSARSGTCLARGGRRDGHRHGACRRVAPAGASVYGDFEALLADPAVDIVHIGTPPFLHGPMARRAAERGKHVFVEKPLATTLEDAQGAIDAARLGSGVQLSIDYVLRHHPLHRLAIASHARVRSAGSSTSRWRTSPQRRTCRPTLVLGSHEERRDPHGTRRPFLRPALTLIGREPDAVIGHRPATVRWPHGPVGRSLLGSATMNGNLLPRFNRTPKRPNGRPSDLPSNAGTPRSMAGSRQCSGWRAPSKPTRCRP